MSQTEVEVKFDELKDFRDKSELEGYESDNTCEQVWVSSLALTSVDSFSKRCKSLPCRFPSRFSDAKQQLLWHWTSIVFVCLAQSSMVLTATVEAYHFVFFVVLCMDSSVSARSRPTVTLEDRKYIIVMSNTCPWACTCGQCSFNSLISLIQVLEYGHQGLHPFSTLKKKNCRNWWQSSDSRNPRTSTKL